MYIDCVFLVLSILHIGLNSTPTKLTFLKKEDYFCTLMVVT